MFLSRLAERSGLLEFLAPRRSKDATDDTVSDKDEQEDSAKDDQKKSNNLDAVERQRKRRLDAQRKLEAEAESRGAFAKKQRVKYYHKATGKWYDDAHIVGVHLDDGPDKPYYTIKYRDGKKQQTGSYVEKQTTPDRLIRVPWDSIATWELVK